MFGGFNNNWPKKTGKGKGKKPNVQAHVVRDTTPKGRSRNVPAVVKRAAPADKRLNIRAETAHSKANDQVPVFTGPLPPIDLSNEEVPIVYVGSTSKFLLSILIPTLTTRSVLLSALLEKLEKQIRVFGTDPRVEVLIDEDNGEVSVGAKRNHLIQESQGDFVVFVDDDDDLSDDYVAQLRRAIVDHPDVDCIGLRSVMTTEGRNPLPVEFSLRHKQPSDIGVMFLRPPQHLTPIRREIAVRHKFEEINLGEDALWARLIAPDLHEEHFIDKVLYHYRFDPKTSATQGAKVNATVNTDDFSIIIPSARAENLIPCVRSIMAMEPTLDPKRIIVIDDGSRAGAEKQIVKGVTWIKGEKPFCFARNVNLGIAAATGDVVIMNDDSTLETKFGMTSMSCAVRGSKQTGACSAAISGFVGNSNQQPVGPTGLRSEPRVLAFVCVYIPRSVIEALGALDERFIGYGFEDNDYCRRILGAKLKLAVYDGCVVRHGDSVETSTFRSKPEISALFKQNRALYEQKWGKS